MKSLLLHYEPQNGQSSHHIEALWLSGPHQMLFAENGGTEQTVSLIRNINDFPQGISTIIHRPAGDNKQPTADIYTMRLVKGESLKLSARDKVSRKDILFEGESEINLIKLLLKSKEQSMGDQEYLDRKYIWDIILTYNTDNYMAINVKINNWTYWFQNTDL